MAVGKSKVVVLFVVVVVVCVVGTVVYGEKKEMYSSTKERDG